MILHMKPSTEEAQAQRVAAETSSILFHDGNRHVLVTPSKLKSAPAQYESLIDASFAMDSDLQLGSRSYIDHTRSVKVGNIEIGGNTNNTILIAGPCSVESEEQIRESATFMKSLGVTALRGGCYKPRTSPYSFQGLGLEGLKLLSKMRDEFGFTIVSEVRDATHVNDVIEHADVIQIGAKSM